MSVAKVLLLAWKLRMQLSKKQEIKGKVIPFDHEVARMEREMTTLKSTTKEKTHGNYRTSTSYH